MLQWGRRRLINDEALSQKPPKVIRFSYSQQALQQPGPSTLEDFNYENIMTPPAEALF